MLLFDIKGPRVRDSGHRNSPPACLHNYALHPSKGFRRLLIPICGICPEHINDYMHYIVQRPEPTLRSSLLRPRSQHMLSAPSRLPSVSAREGCMYEHQVLTTGAAGGAAIWRLALWATNLITGFSLVQM